MKNIPTIMQESEEERALREAERQRQYPTGPNLVYQDYLTSLDGCDSPSFPLTREDLLFLYRLDGDTRKDMTEEEDEAMRAHRERLFRLVCEKRNHSADLAMILGCRRDQIANTPEEIADGTRAYVGNLVHVDDRGKIIPIFSLLPDSVDCIYTKFPEERIFIDKDVVYGGKTREAIRSELREQQCETDEWSEFLLERLLENTQQESADVVRLSVRNMGFPNGATRQQIYDRAEKLGLRVNVPSELGPAMRLRDKDQQRGTYYLMGMKPITGLNGNPSVFFVHCVGNDSRRLDADNFDESRVWFSEDVLAFVRE